MIISQHFSLPFHCDKYRLNIFIREYRPVCCHLGVGDSTSSSLRFSQRKSSHISDDILRFFWFFWHFRAVLQRRPLTRLIFPCFSYFSDEGEFQLGRCEQVISTVCVKPFIIIRVVKFLHTFQPKHLFRTFKTRKREN